MNKGSWDITKELEAISGFFAEYVDLEFEVVKSGIDVEWENEEVARDLIKSITNKTSDIYVLHVLRGDFKKPKALGYADLELYDNQKFICMTSKKGGLRKDNNGWFDDNEFAGRLRHELGHTFYQLANAPGAYYATDNVHKFEDEKNFDKILTDIRWENIKSLNNKNMKKSYINIHHTATFANNDISEQFDSVNESHRKRWNGKTKSKLGFYGGYHYLVERSGVVQQFRGEEEVGAHNDISLMNYRAMGVCFAGNMSRQYLSEAQIKAGTELIKDIQQRNNIPDANVKPHRAYKATQCPGNNFPDPVWDYLQEKYESLFPKKEKWRTEMEVWAAQYLTDVPGFINSPDPHKFIALVKRVFEKK